MCIEGIDNCLSAYTDFYKNNRQYYKLLFFFDLVSDHYRIPKKLLMEIYSRKVASLVELQKVIQKDISGNGSSKEIAYVLFGMLNGIIHLFESKQIKMNDFEKLINIGFKIVIYGITNLKNKT